MLSGRFNFELRALCGRSLVRRSLARFAARQPAKTKGQILEVLRPDEVCAFCIGDFNAGLRRAVENVLTVPDVRTKQVGRPGMSH